MKKSLFIILLFPILCSGQKFDITEMGGYSSSMLAAWHVETPAGFANHFAANYHITNHFSVGLYHDLNLWKFNTNTLGITGDVHLKYLYFGVTTGKLCSYNKAFYQPIAFFTRTGYFPGADYSPYRTLRLNSAFSYGAHIGVEYNLNKNFVYKQEVDYNAATSKGEAQGNNYSIKFRSLSAMAGVGYRF